MEDREILFRGKIGNGWAYGDLRHFKNSVAIFRQGYTFPYLVIPSTVGQYTGLTDQNGVKIFEGDIIETTSGNRGYVVFENGAFMKSCNPKDMPFLIADVVNTVIGNIHDNPELLRGDNNA
ncbi:MAG: hypothetical protein J5994_10770 [Ruminococcus sp.]|nr:hypothetical protein [Ruminococcus sp.]